MIDKAAETTWLPGRGLVGKQASPCGQELGGCCGELWGCTAGESLPWHVGGWEGPLEEVISRLSPKGRPSQPGKGGGVGGGTESDGPNLTENQHIPAQCLYLLPDRPF